MGRTSKTVSTRIFRSPLATLALGGVLAVACSDRENNNDSDSATTNPSGDGDSETEGDGSSSGLDGGSSGETTGTGTSGGTSTTGSTGADTDDFPDPNEGLCEDFGEQNECYTGPPETLDVGECKRGMQVCESVDLDVGEWSECSDTPPAEEVCNGRDDDCDGPIDEDLPNCVG